MSINNHSLLKVLYASSIVAFTLVSVFAFSASTAHGQTQQAQYLSSPIQNRQAANWPADPSYNYVVWTGQYFVLTGLCASGVSANAPGGILVLTKTGQIVGERSACTDRDAQGVASGSTAPVGTSATEGAQNAAGIPAVIDADEFVVPLGNATTPNGPAGHYQITGSGINLIGTSWQSPQHTKARRVAVTSSGTVAVQKDGGFGTDVYQVPGWNKIGESFLSSFLQGGIGSYILGQINYYSAVGGSMQSVGALPGGTSGSAVFPLYNRIIRGTTVYELSGNAFTQVTGLGYSISPGTGGYAVDASGDQYTVVPNNLGCSTIGSTCVPMTVRKHSGGSVTNINVQALPAQPGNLPEGAFRSPIAAAISGDGYIAVSTREGVHIYSLGSGVITPPPPPPPPPADGDGPAVVQFGSQAIGQLQQFNNDTFSAADQFLNAAYGLFPNTSSTVGQPSGNTTGSNSRTGTGGGATTISQSMDPGDSGPEVQLLQQWLNQDPATQVAASGPGSPGQETTFYGPLTESAVQRYQCQQGIVCSGDPQTTGYGRVGPRTLTSLNARYQNSGISVPAPGGASQTTGANTGATTGTTNTRGGQAGGGDDSLAPGISGDARIDNIALRLDSLRTTIDAIGDSLLAGGNGGSNDPSTCPSAYVPTGGTPATSPYTYQPGGTYTAGNGQSAAQLSFSPPQNQVYGRVTVDFDMLFTQYNPANTEGLHNFFWLYRNEWCGNTFGYLNTRGPAKNIIRLTHNAGRSRGGEIALNANNVTLQPNTTYHVSYEYNAAASVISARVTNTATGAVVAQINTSPALLGIESGTKVWKIWLGNPVGNGSAGDEIDGPGWKYTGLKVTFDGSGTPVSTSGGGAGGVVDIMDGPPSAGF